MGGLSLFLRACRHTLGKLCRQALLLAGLALFCAALAFLAGQAARDVLTDGVSFSGITLAVTAPEGDAVPELLAQYLGKMTDLQAYCTIEAMGEAEALAALADGSVTAVLALPEDFVHGVQVGENPDVRVIVDGIEEGDEGPELIGHAWFQAPDSDGAVHIPYGEATVGDIVTVDLVDSFCYELVGELVGEGE